MPFLFIIIGVILVISAIRGTHRDLGELVRGDFTGPNNFFIWMLALGCVGAVGYIGGQSGPLRTPSRAFMALVLLAMLLSNRGFFARLFEAFDNIQGGESQGSGGVGNAIGSQAAPPAAASGAPVTQGSGAQNLSGGSQNPASPAAQSFQQLTNTGEGVIAELNNAGATIPQLGQALRGATNLARVIANPVDAARSFFGGLF